MDVRLSLSRNMEEYASDVLTGNILQGFKKILNKMDENQKIMQQDFDNAVTLEDLDTGAEKRASHLYST